MPSEERPMPLPPAGPGRNSALCATPLSEAFTLKTEGALAPIATGNVMEVLPAGTVTVAGTVTPPSAERFTVTSPAEGYASDTVPWNWPPGAIDREIETSPRQALLAAAAVRGARSNCTDRKSVV